MTDHSPRGVRSLGALALVGFGLAAWGAPAAGAGPPFPGQPAPRGSSSTAPPEEEGEDEPSDHHASPSLPTRPSTPAEASTREGMARVPGGRVTIGSAEAKAPANEKPPRDVVVAPFWIDVTEVTVGAYRVCVERGACPRPPRTAAACTYDGRDGALPISCVSWALASAYCSFVGKRLPREAEWEVAARGAFPKRYPWGGQTTNCGLAVTLAREGVQRSCGKAGPARVGGRPAGASPYGALDMSGNVEEWVSDWYAGTVADPSPRSGASHVLRGGGWLTPPSLATTTARNWGSAREAGPNVGFRCARDAGDVIDGMPH